MKNNKKMKVKHDGTKMADMSKGMMKNMMMSEREMSSMRKKMMKNGR